MPDNFQERFEQINDELRLMTDRMEELRAALNQTRDSNVANAIKQQMSMLQDQQARLLREQQEHSRALQQIGRLEQGYFKALLSS